MQSPSLPAPLLTELTIILGSQASDQTKEYQATQAVSRGELTDSQYAEAISWIQRKLHRQNEKVTKELVLDELVNLPPRQFILDRLHLEKGMLITICGTGESGKTLFAQHLALAFANSKPILGCWRAEDTYKVLHIDLEQNETLTRRRYTRLGAGLGLQAKDIHGIARATLPHKIDDASLSTSQQEEMLVSLFQGYSVVIIDSLRQMVLADENNSQIGTPLGLLRSVAEKTNTLVLLITHKGKGTENAAKQTGRGSSVIYDVVDGQIDLKATHTDDAVVIEVSCAKNRDAIRWQGFSYRLVDKGEYIRHQHCTTQLCLEVLDQTMANPDQQKQVAAIKFLREQRECNLTQMREVLHIKGIKADQMIEDMKQQKLLTERKSGNTRLFALGENAQTFLDYEAA
jgi:RecA-family ATPase